MSLKSDQYTELIKQSTQAYNACVDAKKKVEIKRYKDFIVKEYNEYLTINTDKPIRIATYVTGAVSVVALFALDLTRRSLI